MNVIITSDSALNDELVLIHKEEIADAEKWQKSYNVINRSRLKGEEKISKLLILVDDSELTLGEKFYKKYSIIEFSEFNDGDKRRRLVDLVEKSPLTKEEKVERIREIEESMSKPDFYDAIVYASVIVKLMAFIGGADTYVCVFPVIYGLISFLGDSAYVISHIACLVLVSLIDFFLFRLINDFKKAMLNGLSMKEDWKPITAVLGLVVVLGGMSIGISIFMRDFTGEILLKGFKSVQTQPELIPQKQESNILAFDIFQSRMKALEEEQKDALFKAGTPYQRSNADKSLFLKNLVETEREKVTKKYSNQISDLMKDFGGVAKLYATKDTALTNQTVRKEAEKIRMENLKIEKLGKMTMWVAVGSTIAQLFLALWIIFMAGQVNKNSYDDDKLYISGVVRKLKS